MIKLPQAWTTIFVTLTQSFLPQSDIRDRRVFGWWSKEWRLGDLPGHSGKWNVKLKLRVIQSCLTLRSRGLYSPWNSPGQNTGVGSCSLLQGIFPNQGLNPGLLHCRWFLYQLSHQGIWNVGTCFFPCLIHWLGPIKKHLLWVSEHVWAWKLWLWKRSSTPTYNKEKFHSVRHQLSLLSTRDCYGQWWQQPNKWNQLLKKIHIFNSS